MYQIDQSGKIEDTGKPTVIAFSNSRTGTVILSAKHKREIQKTYRAKGKNKIYTIQIFSAMVYVLLEKHNISNKPIVVDLEYKGHEGLIRNYILQLARKRHKISMSSFDLGFFSIGKSSNAHKLAIEGYRNKHGDFVIGKEELIRLAGLYES